MAAMNKEKLLSAQKISQAFAMFDQVLNIFAGLSFSTNDCRMVMDI